MGYLFLWMCLQECAREILTTEKTEFTEKNKEKNSVCSVCSVVNCSGLPTEVDTTIFFLPAIKRPLKDKKPAWHAEIFARSCAEISA